MMAALWASKALEGTMSRNFRLGGKAALLAMMIAMLGGCGTVISAAGTAVSTTFDIATDVVGTTADVVTSPFDGDDEPVQRAE